MSVQKLRDSPGHEEKGMRRLQQVPGTPHYRFKRCSVLKGEGTRRRVSIPCSYNKAIQTSSVKNICAYVFFSLKICFLLADPL